MDIQPWQLLTGIGVVLFVLAMLLIWGERPELAAAIRRWFEPRPMSRVSVPAPLRSVELPAQTSRQTAQTDQQTPRPSALRSPVDRLLLDKTRQAVLDLLLTHGWTITDLRREGILRGDNSAISDEVAAARLRLGLAEERTITMRDSAGERRVPTHGPLSH